MRKLHFREKMYEERYLRNVIHTTLNPYGPGSVRIHMVPPKRTLNKEVPYLVFLNGSDILPIKISWAILLSGFIEEVNLYEGKEITKEDAYNMYNAMWNQHNLGYLKDKSIAVLLNDYMINSNEWEVAKRVQEILNKKGHEIKVDRIIGPKTIEAINKTDRNWLIEEILIDRYKNYRKQVKNEYSQIHNYKGWINRLNKIAELVGSGTRFPVEY